DDRRDSDDARARTNHPLRGRASQSQPPRDYRGPACDRIRSDPGGTVCRSRLPGVVRARHRDRMLHARAALLLRDDHCGWRRRDGCRFRGGSARGYGRPRRAHQDRSRRTCTRDGARAGVLQASRDSIDTSGRYESQRHFVYDASVAGVRAAGRCKLDPAQPARVLAMGRAATADVQLVRRSFAMVVEGMADVAVARERVRAVHSGPGGKRYRAQRLHLYRGGVFLPGTGDCRVLLSVALSSVDRTRDNLFCRFRAAVCGCARVHRGRLRYVDRLPAAQAPQPGSEQPGRFLLRAGRKHGDQANEAAKTMNVQVILNEDLPNLGRTGDVVKVRAGYARNYLLPRKLAVEADQKNLRAFEHQKRTAARHREIKRTDALAVKARIEALALTLTARAGEEGKLFGSVTNIDLERALRENG